MLRTHDFASGHDDLACDSFTSMRSAMAVYLNRTYVFS
jgi:hypothetical protein